VPLALLWQFLLPALLVVVFVGLFVIGFVRPRHSRKAENDVARTLALAAWWASGGSALRRFVAKQLARSRRGARKSARAGRKARASADGQSH
jgi:hypothetical protein